MVLGLVWCKTYVNGIGFVDVKPMLMVLGLLICKTYVNGIGFVPCKTYVIWRNVKINCWSLQV